MKYLIFVALAFCMLSCGPSAEERRRLQAMRDDSIRKATEEATQLRLARKRELENLILQINSSLEGIENRLSVLNAEEVVQQDKLLRIRQPRFLRTPAEREQQIRDQVILIERIHKEIQALIQSRSLAKEKLVTVTKAHGEISLK